MAERRELTIDDLDRVLTEVDTLLSHGYECVGQWSLGQICNHLTTSVKLLLHGDLDVKPPLVSEAIKTRFLQVGRFPEGATPPHPRLFPRIGLDDRSEAESLRHWFGRFANATGPFPAHPILGILTKDEWTRFHCMHAAHHLGFLVPKGE